LECRDYKGDNKITGLVIQKGIGGKGSIVAFKTGDDDYKILYTDLNGSLPPPKKTEKEEYETLVKIIYQTTQATDEALREASGGNENRKTVDRAYKQFAEKMKVGELLSDEEIKDNIFVKEELISNALLFLKKFEMLVEKGEGVDWAKKVVVGGLGSFVSSVSEHSLNLLKALLEKGYFVEEAMIIAENSTLILDLEIQEFAFKLWDLFFKYNQGFEQAIKKSLEGLEKEESRKIGEDLLEKVLRNLKNKAPVELRAVANIREAIDAAKRSERKELISLAEELEQKLREAESQKPLTLKTETLQGVDVPAAPSQQIVEPAR
jgi:hypothetical protein